jgi:glycogen(starch) synthase
MRHREPLAGRAAALNAGPEVRRVLMTADSVGGVWTYALDLIAALAPYGITVTLAVMGPEMSTAQRESLGHLDNVSLIEQPFDLEWEADPWDDVEAARDWLLAIATSLRPDVVHLNGFALGNSPWPCPVIVVGHSCVLSWWEAVRREPAPPQWSRYRDAVRRGLAAADTVVAPTAAMRRALHSHYGPLSGSRVIFNGRSTPVFARHGQEPLVLCAGRLWDDAKNVRALVAAAPEISWPVYLAGALTPPSAEKEPTVPLEHVTCLGPLSREGITDWMARASIYVLPARYEPFGLSALEAAQTGTALVLGGIDSLVEVWGDAAVYVPPDDSHAIAEAVESLIHDGPRRADLARRARERAAELTPARMAAGYVDVYRGAVSRHRAAAATSALGGATA